MSDVFDLAADLVEEDPDTAATALSDLAPDAIKSFVEALPEESAGGLLSALPVPVAADCLEHLAPDRAANLLHKVGYPKKAGVVRAISARSLAPILGAMSGAKAQQIRRDMAYAPDAVGAWMEETTAIVSEDETVGVVLPRLRRQRRLEATLIVCGSRRRYVGLLPVNRLIGARDGARLGDLADKSIPALDPDSQVAEVAGLSAWTSYVALPVAGKLGGLLGILRAESLRRGIDQQVAGGALPGSGLVSHLMEAALISATNLSLLLPEAGTPAQTADRRNTR